jgi:uncharacterized cupin superfamily protein
VLIGNAETIATVESTMTEHPEPVVNVADLDYREFGQGEKYAARTARIGPLIGLTGLGCMAMIVAPGKRAFPFHVHHANHELFIVLEGTGQYRYGGKTYPIKAGDVLAAPAGGPEFAHQIVNTGAVDLRYLGISTMTQPEVVEYPDSGKFAVSSLMDDGAPSSARLRFVGRKETSIDYWEGE